MATKHDVLTEDELASFSVNHFVLECLDQTLERFPDLTPEEINVLDWGCGRGRSVAKLREKGFNAFGIDIDEKTMSNGFSLFENRGLAPHELLKPVLRIGEFPDGFFHMIFSEQVFEHVCDLAGVISEQSRITRANGLGVHCFPGAKNVWEDHLKMPFVHWLPKTFARRYWIGMMLILRFGPKTGWPGVNEMSFQKQLDVYYQYMNNKTYYRDSEAIQHQFEESGFDADYRIAGRAGRLRRLFPGFLTRNGFPRGAVVFRAMRRDTA
jgi:SAM-dependent methyltransferase